MFKGLLSAYQDDPMFKKLFGENNLSKNSMSKVNRNCGVVPPIILRVLR